MDTLGNARMKLIRALGAAISEAQGEQVGHDVIDLSMALHDYDDYQYAFLRLDEDELNNAMSGNGTDGGYYDALGRLIVTIIINRVRSTI